MQRLYGEVAKELLEALKMYCSGEMPLSEVKRLNEKENIIYNLKDWKSKRGQIKEEIFKRVKGLHDKTTELGRFTALAEKLSEENIVEIDEGAVLAHAQLLGRNRFPDPHFSNSGWFVGPYPTLQMLTALRNVESQNEPNSTINRGNNQNEGDKKR